MLHSFTGNYYRMSSFPNRLPQLGQNLGMMPSSSTVQLHSLHQICSGENRVVPHSLQKRPVLMVPQKHFQPVCCAAGAGLGLPQPEQN